MASKHRDEAPYACGRSHRSNTTVKMQTRQSAAMEASVLILEYKYKDVRPERAQGRGVGDADGRASGEKIWPFGRFTLLVG